MLNGSPASLNLSVPLTTLLPNCPEAWYVITVPEHGAAATRFSEAAKPDITAAAIAIDRIFTTIELFLLFMSPRMEYSFEFRSLYFLKSSPGANAYRLTVPVLTSMAVRRRRVGHTAHSPLRCVDLLRGQRRAPHEVGRRRKVTLGHPPPQKKQEMEESRSRSFKRPRRGQNRDAGHEIRG